MNIEDVRDGKKILSNTQNWCPCLCRKMMFCCLHIWSDPNGFFFLFRQLFNFCCCCCWKISFDIYNILIFFGVWGNFFTIFFLPKKKWKNSEKKQINNWTTTKLMMTNPKYKKIDRKNNLNLIIMLEKD